MPLPVVLDTDIGTDIDDAYALVLAASAPELDLRAVTTVNNDVTTRALIALALLRDMGRSDVPVLAGAEQSLTPGETRGWCGHEARGIDVTGLDAAHDLDRRSVPDAIAEAARDADADGTPLTLITIGAMTNAAIAIRQHPESMRRLGGIVAMASTFAGYGRDNAAGEHNVACDPVAAQIVLAAGIPVTLVGLNVTMQTRITRAQVDRLDAAGTPLGRGLAGMHRVWFDMIQRSESPMHDPLAVAWLLQPSLLHLESVRATVLLDAAQPGAIEYNPGGPDQVTRIATRVDVDAFHSLLWQRVACAVSNPR